MGISPSSGTYCALTVTGEAREVHNAYMDEWNFTNRANPNFRRARRAERLRAVFRVYGRDRSAFLSLRALQLTS